MIRGRVKLYILTTFSNFDASIPTVVRERQLDDTVIARVSKMLRIIDFANEHIS